MRLSADKHRAPAAGARLSKGLGETLERRFAFEEFQVRMSTSKHRCI
jgi:hypothetical protein